MARNTNIARLPHNPKISVTLEWEKEGERGRLVFSDPHYTPITIEVDELKGTQQPLIRIMYYRYEGETACCIRAKERFPLNAQSIMGGIEVNLNKMRSTDPALDVPEMIFYKTREYVRQSELCNFSDPYRLIPDELCIWAENLYRNYGANHEARAIYDHSTGRLIPVKAGDSLTIDDLSRRAPVSYRQLIMTPGVIPGLDVHDTIPYCVARKVSLDDIAFFVSLPKSKVKEIIGESLLGEKKTRTPDENESKLYPRGTIFSTVHPGPRPHVAYWQVIRCTEKTLWVQELKTKPGLYDQIRLTDLPVPNVPANSMVYQCRINPKLGRETPIHVCGQLAHVWQPQAPII